MLKWLVSEPMRTGFYVAAAFNVLGMLSTTKGFTAFPLAPLYPGLFGPEGCALIVVWGLAYASVASCWRAVPALCAVFALEKLFYGLSWLVYWAYPATPSWAVHLSEHPDAVLFYSVYGAGDFGFMLLFAAAAWLGARGRG